MAEKYIVVAHPIEFTRKALCSFIKNEGYLTYELEVDDDIAFKAADLNPIALVIDEEFKHNGVEYRDLIKTFQTENFEIAGKVDPLELCREIKRVLESH